MKNLKKTWMTTLLIGGTYLCVAGSAMAKEQFVINNEYRLLDGYPGLSSSNVKPDFSASSSSSGLTRGPI